MTRGDPTKEGDNALKTGNPSKERRKESLARVTYGASSKRRAIIIAAVAFLILLLAVVAAMVGAANLTAEDVLLSIGHALLPNYVFPPSSQSADLIVLNLRLPRIILALVTGFSLALAGTVMQGILRNPLVDPFILGLSSSAAFGAALAIVLSSSVLLFLTASTSYYYFVVIMAFVFGTLSMISIYFVAKLKGTEAATIILAGVAFSYIFSAGVSLLKYFSTDEKLREVTVWLLGGMWGANWQAIAIIVPISLICGIALWYKSWDFNALLAGDEVAQNLGVNVDRLRLVGLTISTIAASVCVAFTGIIGFIGLMAPHISRIFVGNDYRFLIPCSCLVGGFILLLSDTIARTIISPTEIPVGIITSLIGGPFFFILIMRRKVVQVS